MLKGYDIICFSSDWRQDPLSKHHIMSRLARQNRVLWINSIGMRTPTISRQDFTKGYNKLKNYFQNRLEKVNDNLYVLSPLVLPFHGSKPANYLNKYLLLWQVKHCQKRLGLNHPILWSFLPNAVSVFGKLGEKLALYYITDDFTKFTGHPSESIARMEEELLDRADLLISSSRHLAEIKGRGKLIHFIGHGVDHRHFNRALGIGPEGWPEDIRGVKRPVIGFYGEINDWLDLEMIRQAAILKPEWSFALLGRVAVEAGDLNYLKDVKNIHLLGQKKFDDLPAYCASFDVGLIPMKMNELTACVNPLKLREYLAAGLPVVSAPLPEVLPFGDVVKFADSAQEYILAIENVLKVPKQRQAAILSQRVKNESWDSKVVEISAIIEEALEKQCSRTSQ